MSRYTTSDQLFSTSSNYLVNRKKTMKITIIRKKELKNHFKVKKEKVKKSWKAKKFPWFRALGMFRSGNLTGGIMYRALTVRRFCIFLKPDNNFDDGGVLPCCPLAVAMSLNKTPNILETY